MKSDTTVAPAFRRIATHLSDQVRSGELLPGQALAPRRELAVTFGVNINTMNRAIEVLVAEGVLQTAERMGTFVAPGCIPASPVPRRMALAGVLFSALNGEAAHGWGPMVQRALEGALSQSGVATRSTRIAGGYPGALATALSESLAGGTEALAISWLQNQAAWPGEFLASLPRDLPVVIVSTTALDLPVPHTCVDDRQDGWRAAGHLLSAGYREVLPVGWFSNPWWTQRWEGAALALANAGIAATAPAVRGTWEDWADSSQVDRGQRLAAELEAVLAARGGAPLALLCANDAIAVAMADELVARGVRLGSEIGLIGWDDSLAAGERNLTSVRQPLVEMAEHAARLLEDIIAGREVPVQSRFCGRLILRQSTRLA